MSRPNKVVLLVLLDLSAAFDTIDHDILLHRLEHYFGFSGTVLHWIQSYLTARFQQVYLQDSKSSKSPLKWGVPQGSVLGPLLFSLYVTPLGNIIRSHSVHFHMYADDVQLYLSSDPSSSDTAKSRLENCIMDIHTWMSANKLKFNKYTKLYLDNFTKNRSYFCIISKTKIGSQKSNLD